MRVLVTGASGFIGRHVCHALIQKGHEPIRCDRRAETDFRADMSYHDQVHAAVGSAEGVIHLAGLLGTQEMVDHPYPAVMTNIVGGLNVLEAVKAHSVPACFIGVGNHWMNNTYSITKTTVERFVQMFNKEHGTAVNIIRAVNAYGPGQEPPIPYGKSRVRKIMPTFVSKALRNEPLEIYGNGKQVSDMVYVSDVASSLVRGLELAAKGTVLPAIEVGPLKHNTVLEVAQLVIASARSQSTIEHLPMRPGEEPNSKVSADPETMEAAGINPRDFVSLEEGVAETIAYYRAA